MAAVPVRKRIAVSGMCFASPPSASSSGTGLREDVARAEKEQALEQRVVERVQQGARDAAQRDELVARGFAQRGDAESDEDDADVLDRGVGQQAFHVVLHGCEDHAPLGP